MNWGSFAVLFFFLVVLLSLLVAVIAYVRHWAKRRAIAINDFSPTDGLFFKRYVPPSLHKKYDPESIVVSSARYSRIKYLEKTLVTTVVLLAIGIVSTSLYLHSDKYIAKTGLAEDEIGRLNYQIIPFSETPDAHLPRLDTVLPLLRRKDIVLLYDKPDPISGSHPHSNPGLTQWSKFLTSHQVKYMVCRWSRVNSCITHHADSVVIVLPGNWDLKILDDLLLKNSNILLYGPPNDVSEKHVVWQKLRFEKSEHYYEHLSIVADQKLTLGFDAGLQIKVRPSFFGYRAVSEKAQAIGIHTHNIKERSFDTRLYAPDLSSGRLVWMDFSPNPSDHPPGLNNNNLNSLTASIFRYLLGITYSDVATWPLGKAFAAYLSIDISQGNENIRHILDLVDRNEFPFNWYIFSDYANGNKQLIKQMGSKGEIVCKGDNNSKFTHDYIVEQVSRLARCKKTLGLISRKEIKGFSPPEHAYNEITINALINNGMAFFAAKPSNDGVPTIINSSRNSNLIVAIPNSANTRLIPWQTDHFASEETLSLLMSEIDRSQQLGSLYSVTIKDEFISDKSYVLVLNEIASYLQKADIFFSSISGISEWWTLRESLRNNLDHDDKLLEKYKPVLLEVDERGHLQRNDLYPDKSASITASK
ncbi:MAG: polysaccharide deacetylase family protein [Candidatus Thiodiazotropha sp.]